MATIKGANRTIMDNITPATVLDPGLAGGVVRCMIDTYTALGTEVATTVIEMGGDLPKGARVLKVVVYNGDAASTLAVGDAGSSGRYEDSVAATATEHISVADEIGICECEPLWAGNIEACECVETLHEAMKMSEEILNDPLSSEDTRDGAIEGIIEIRNIRFHQKRQGINTDEETEIVH